MGDLTTCPSCQRHVRASESSCPFCKGKVIARQVGGALAVAVGASLLSGCPRPPAPVYGGPPPTLAPQPSPSATPEASKAPEAIEAPEASETPEASPSLPRPTPAYGAPAVPDPGPR